MPITCPIDFEPLSTAAFRSLDYVVMNHAFAAHKDLGRLADGSVYHADLGLRLANECFSIGREVPVTVSFETFRKAYFLDMVVYNKAGYELKAVPALTKAHSVQRMNDLAVAGPSAWQTDQFSSRICREHIRPHAFVGPRTQTFFRRAKKLAGVRTPQTAISSRRVRLGLLLDRVYKFAQQLFLPAHTFVARKSSTSHPLDQAWPPPH
jgi:GxxExxY protein